MTSAVVFSPANQAVLDTCSRYAEQKVLRAEYDRIAEVDALHARHEAHLTGDEEQIRLAEETYRVAALATVHAELMKDGAWLELYAELKQMARGEIAAESHTTDYRLSA